SPRIVTLGASLGGLPALSIVLSGLPADFPAPVMVVQHRAASVRDLLPAILERQTDLTVTGARHGDELRPGTVYVAPSDQHLLVDSERSLALSHADRHSRVRPSADLLFTSAAEVFRDQAIGVVLTGRQSDGATGSWAIKAMGGRVLGQCPGT